MESKYMAFCLNTVIVAKDAQKIEAGTSLN
jgi:hypothetical protein